MDTRSLHRIGLLALGVPQLVSGLQALAAPQSFHDDFPFGRGWVAAFGSYNEHYATDVGSALLALAVLVIAAAVILERRATQVALVGWLGFAVPHLVYHVATADELGTGDTIANLTTVGLAVAIPIALLATAGRLERAGSRQRPGG
jgi:hypothetical protein